MSFLQKCTNCGRKFTSNEAEPVCALCLHQGIMIQGMTDQQIVDFLDQNCLAQNHMRSNVGDSLEAKWILRIPAVGNFRRSIQHYVRTNAKKS